MINLTVRRACLADLEALSRLFDQYRQFQGQERSPAAAHAFLQTRLDRRESVIFIALEGTRTIGFVQLYPSFSSIALKRVFILNDLFVEIPARRRQVGHALLRAAEAYAWDNSAARVTLCVAKGNTAAQAVYEAAGWQRDEQFFIYHQFTPTAAPHTQGDDVE
jgi:ribosomal protein S18 acetylase RimI-like enzyme